MSAVSLFQLISACIGIIGSLFFAVGIMRQSIEAMARLSGTYWDMNPHMPPALAAQKSDYVFGGGLIFLAFILQFASFFAPTSDVLSAEHGRIAPWVAGAAVIALFLALQVASALLAKHYEKKIVAWLSAESSKKHVTPQ